MANLSMSRVYRLLALDWSHKPLVLCSNRKRQPIRGDKNRKLQLTRSIRIPNRIWEIGPCCGSQNGAVTQQAAAEWQRRLCQVHKPASLFLSDICERESSDQDFDQEHPIIFCQTFKPQISVNNHRREAVSLSCSGSFPS